MDAPARIAKLLSQRQMEREQLAEILGVDRSAVSRFLSGERSPGQLTCLALAGLSNDPHERKYWINAAGLSAGTLTAITNAVTGKRELPDIANTEWHDRLDAVLKSGGTAVPVVKGILSTYSYLSGELVPEAGVDETDPLAQELSEAYHNGPTGIKNQIRSALSEFREIREKAQQKASHESNQHGREAQPVKPRKSNTA